MSPKRPPTTNRPDGADSGVRRRRLLSLGAGVGVTLLAGCASDTAPGDAGGSPATSASGDGTERYGRFRLLVSDQPVAIGEFDSLDVTFDSARVFHGEDVEAETSTDDPAATANATTTAATTEPADAPANETDADTEEEAEGRGFFTLDLDGATVDLTEVVGERAMGVFDGELPEGRYSKVELHAASVDGVVDGDPVEVTIPSGKLQLVKPFEVSAGETLRFVFDINVVRRGRTNAYNLLPVISESGVAGEDVEVDEVGSGDGEDAGTEPSAEPEEEGGAGNATGTGGGNGPPDDVPAGS